MSTTPPTVTESEVLAFVKFHGERIAAMFPTLNGVYLSISTSGLPCMVVGYTSGQVTQVLASGRTVAEALALFTKRCPAPAKEAADLRARAAELLATADRLSPQSA